MCSFSYDGAEAEVHRLASNPRSVLRIGAYIGQITTALLQGVRKATASLEGGRAEPCQIFVEAFLGTEEAYEAAGGEHPPLAEDEDEGDNDQCYAWPAGARFAWEE